jgi:hypothetical protein
MPDVAAAGWTHDVALRRPDVDGKSGLLHGSGTPDAGAR